MPRPLIGHVWGSLSDETQRRVAEVRGRAGPQAFVARKRLADDFNKIIERDDFFDEALWAEAKLIPRAEEMRGDPNLSGDALKQFNRLALEAALPGQLRPCPEEAMMFRYAKWDMDFLPPFPRKLAVELIDTFVLGFMAVFVGFFGIFAAILVTAPIIPGMLDSGSLYVLLSKPVSRPMIFVAKFIGGCSFVFINASYLIIGLWLVLGLRFEMWKPQVLWSIPIFLFPSRSSTRYLRWPVCSGAVR